MHDPNAKLELGKIELKPSWKNFVALYRAFVGLGMMMINGSIGALLQLITRGRATRFNIDYLSPVCCELALRLMGIKTTYPKKSDYPTKQVVYTFNHNSHLDVFTLFAIRIPKARYMLSENGSHILPIHLCNLTIKSFLIPVQAKHEQRKEFLIKTTETLKKHNFSMVASSEGNHQYGHYIDKFNRGIYHMALKSGLDICPIYIDTPKECNPFQSFYFKRGKVKVEVMPLVSTKDWKEETLDQHVAMVRQMYVDKFNEINRQEG